MKFSGLKVLNGGSQSGALLRKSFHKCHDQNFCNKIAFSGQHWTGQSIEECEQFSFLGSLIKVSVSVLNFSPEPAGKPTI